MIERDLTSKNDMYCDVCKKRNPILTKTKQGWICEACIKNQ
jgi:hypothetical protein